MFALAVVGLSGPAHAQWVATSLHPAGATVSEISAVTTEGEVGSVRLASGAWQPSLWSGIAASWLDLSTGPPLNGNAYGAVSGTQVGMLAGHAVLWHGSPQSLVDLHPPGLPFSSVALAAAGDQQVGYYAGVSNRALLWHGSAASVVDLTPQGATDAYANATDGTHQGGVASFNQVWHAGIWSGSAQSFLDLNPPTSGASWLYGIGPGQQVGYIQAGTLIHAAIWSGTASSVLDVDPGLLTGGESTLFATTGSIQVGESDVPGGVFAHAGIWFGTASSFVDLHQFLPAGYSSSRATSVVHMPDGSILVGGWALASGATGQRQAFIWTYAPAPGSGWVLFAGGVIAARRRRAR
jgi:hypothetical protein